MVSQEQNGSRTPLVSVILPTRDGEADLRRLLPALRAQVFDGELEILAVDSESTDGSVEVLEEHGAQVHLIAAEEFSHGDTRNRCAALARGEFLLFVSQDVEPSDVDFLANLLAAFDDPRVAGAYSRVLPHPEDDLLTARTVLDLPESSDEGWVRDLDDVPGVWELDPDLRAEYLRFNNVASCIRASVFREIPFPDVAFAEDFAWASRALTAGHRIAYVPTSAVYHAHAYSMGAAFERYRVDALFHYLAHGLQVRPTVTSAVRGFLYEVWRDARFLREHEGSGRAGALLRSPALRAAQVLGQYVGSHGWSSGGRSRTPLHL